jgi:hypothetical protein
VYEKCLNAGYRVDQHPYEKYDSLASDEDLEMLLNLLVSYKDSHGNHPIITANVLTANPDFEKIRERDFMEYCSEPIIDTFKKYPKHANAFGLWEKGMINKVFFPQSHGKEHLNVSMFMNALQRGDQDARFGFDNNMPGSIPKQVKHGKNPYVEALKYDGETDKYRKLSRVQLGLSQFNELFKYKSESFIAPNYWWSPDFDEVVSGEGVRYYQGNRIMKEPFSGDGYVCHKYKLGQENKYNQYYLVRNGYFEPSLFQSDISDPVSSCLRDISAAFRMKKPAILCSHRINYVGFIDERNRDQNLRYLQQLLGTIMKKWPDVEFMNSVQLGKLMSSSAGS